MFEKQWANEYQAGGERSFYEDIGKEAIAIPRMKMLVRKPLIIQGWIKGKQGVMKIQLAYLKYICQAEAWGALIKCKNLSIPPFDSGPCCS